jgi:6-pyruvoyl-tetrahydropterin synthase
LFTISVQTSFWASHQLKLSDGRQEKLHRHNWLVQAKVCSGKLDQAGFCFDFNRLKAILTRITDTLAAGQFESAVFIRHLCGAGSADKDNPCIDGKNLSAEIVAQYIYEKLEKELPAEIKLESVTVTEEPGCSASFTKD